MQPTNPNVHTKGRGTEIETHGEENFKDVAALISVKCEVLSVNCRVWSVKCRVWGVKCKVRSGK